MKQQCQYIINLWAHTYDSSQEYPDEHDVYLNNSFLFSLTSEEKELLEKISQQATRYQFREDQVGFNIIEANDSNILLYNPGPED